MLSVVSFIGGTSGLTVRPNDGTVLPGEGDPVLGFAPGKFEAGGVAEAGLEPISLPDDNPMVLCEGAIGFTLTLSAPSGGLESSMAKLGFVMLLMIGPDFGGVAVAAAVDGVFLVFGVLGAAEPANVGVFPLSPSRGNLAGTSPPAPVSCSFLLLTGG